MTTAMDATRAAIGRMVDFDLSGAWLVDPSTGREGPADLVVTDGIIETVTWLEADDDGAGDDRGVVV
ncbi:MAG TPA: hypothetical protein VGM49_02730, partial [Candidatus Limnocylindrales bacterium]